MLVSSQTSCEEEGVTTLYLGKNRTEIRMLFGAKIKTRLAINLIYGVHYEDLPPFLVVLGHATEHYFKDNSR